MRIVGLAARAFSLFLSASSPMVAQENTVQRAFTTPVLIERATPSTVVPIEVKSGKLHLSASIQGIERDFIFDTGSPTILARDFADALELKIIGQNTGIDANGAPVTMDVAVVQEIILGEITFRNVPVLIHDYTQVPQGGCFFDGGVLGSELLPGSAWRIDLGQSRLEIAESSEVLGVSADAASAPLHDFGYPHMPVVDYSVNGFNDKALFDTGNSGQVALFRQIAEDREVRSAIEPGSISRGRGSEGVSASGMGASVDLQRFTLSGFRIGERALGEVDVLTRGSPPTLIGVGLLDRYVVTLDYPAGQMRWLPRKSQPPQVPWQGFSVMLVDGSAKVVQLFQGSPAERAGLRLGDRVLEIAGRSLATTDETERCSHARWLSERSRWSPATTITVEREGAPVELELN